MTGGMPLLPGQVFEHIATRARLGKKTFRFPSRDREVLLSLANAGFVKVTAGPMPGTVTASLTAAGAREVFHPGYEHPASAPASAPAPAPAPHRRPLVRDEPRTPAADVHDPDLLDRVARALRDADNRWGNLARAGDPDSWLRDLAGAAINAINEPTG